MEVLKTIGFVAVFTTVFLFLSWLIYTLSGRNVETIFRVVKWVLIISTFVGVAVWITKSALTYVFSYQLSEVDYPSVTLILDIIFCAVNYLIWVLMVKNNRNIHSRFHGSAKQLRNLYDFQGSFSKTSLLFTISIIGAPAFNIVDIWYLISQYFLK